MGDDKMYKAALTLSIATPVGVWGRAATLDCVWREVSKLCLAYESIEYQAENMGFSDLYDNRAVLVTLAGLFTEAEVDTATATAKILRMRLEETFGSKARVKFRLSKVLVTLLHPLDPAPNS